MPSDGIRPAVHAASRAAATIPEKPPGLANSPGCSTSTHYAARHFNVKIDRIRFPQIPADLPEGAALNENRARGVVYVYTEKMTGGERKRVNIAKIDKDGNFSYLPGYLRELENRRLRSEVRQLRRESETIRDAVGAADKTLDEAVLPSDTASREESAPFVMNNVLACGLAALLGGADDCRAVCDYIATHRATLDALFGKDVAPRDLSFDGLRRLLFTVDPKCFKALAGDLTEPLLLEGEGKALRVDSADGRARRSNGKRRPRTDFLMLVWDSDLQALFEPSKIADTVDEFENLPEILASLNLQGAVLTADAHRSRGAVAEAIRDLGADYCFALRPEKFGDDVRALFNGAGVAPSPISTESTTTDLGNGRIEERVTSVIPGRSLNRKFRDAWPGLDEGVVVKHVARRVEKTSGVSQDLEERYFACSLPPASATPRRMNEIVRKHRRLEENPRSVLDVQFDRERANATNATCAANMSRMKKLVLGLLYRERAFEKASGNTVPLKTLRQRCGSPAYALELLRRHGIRRD